MTLSTTTLNDIQLTRLDGTPERLGDYADKVILAVNVASRCGHTPQYEQLEELQRTYANHGFTVLGFPSNQFRQELKSADAIDDYCSTTWGVTFPMFEATKVNGRSRHPLFSLLHRAKDPSGRGGRVRWNFEKFLILPNGDMHRFRSKTLPDDRSIVELIEGALPEE
ncbi:MAG: glutathione peroxidase [Homoserinimonas sp.]